MDLGDVFGFIAKAPGRVKKFFKGADFVARKSGWVIAGAGAVALVAGGDGENSHAVDDTAALAAIDENAIYTLRGGEGEVVARGNVEVTHDDQGLPIVRTTNGDKPGTHVPAVCDAERRTWCADKDEIATALQDG